MILPDGTLSGHLETVGNPNGVNALVQQILGLLQHRRSGRTHTKLISSYCPFKMILPDGTLNGYLETVGNPDGVDPFVKQILGLLQQSAATLISSYCPLSWPYLMAHCAAISKPSAILMGWMPLSNRYSACSSRAPQSTTTPVVPSPISSS
jgi:hypothetical protein